MKQKGRAIIGDPIKVESYTNSWLQVRLHPSVFYRRYDQFMRGLGNVSGLYAELDLGQYVAIRFSEKKDVTAFHKLHHEYL